MKFKRSIEALVTPTVPPTTPVDWLGVDSIRVRINGHEVSIKSTKEGLEIEYAVPKNKKAAAVATEVNSLGAKLRITP
jgi:hypothetical protein